jgi:chromosome segregation ATPase
LAVLSQVASDLTCLGNVLKDPFDRSGHKLERWIMATETTLTQALERLEKALNGLEQAVDLRLDKEGDFAEAEEEVQRMNADRSRLAQELDNSEARAERLETANREVSRRLVTAMETIRTVLDR